jgi:hypothetical protein
MGEAGLVAGFDRLAQGDVSGVPSPLEFFKFVKGDQHGHRLALFRQHDTLVTAPSTIDEFSELDPGRGHREREGHASNGTDAHSRMLLTTRQLQIRAFQADAAEGL